MGFDWIEGIKLRKGFKFKIKAMQTLVKDRNWEIADLGKKNTWDSSIKLKHSQIMRSFLPPSGYE